MKKIMVADDDAGILDAMQIMLEDAGYEVEAIADGNLVQEMKGDVPDLLLLDIWMSGIDGSAICRHLKSQTRTKHIPIILCSANKDTQKLAQESGADDFLAKPFEMNDLLDKVEKLVG